MQPLDFDRRRPTTAKFLAENTQIKSLEIWTRITELGTDSRSLRELIRTLNSRDVDVKVRDSNHLHLKVYLADRSAVILGSANLTQSGFQSNSEIIAYTSDPSLIEQVIAVLTDTPTNVVTDQDLEEFICTQLPLLDAHAASVSPQPKLETPWRDRPSASIQELVRTGVGRRAFLFGSDSSSGRVQEIVKIADWRGRSINIYNLTTGRTRKISPASEADIEYYIQRGIEIKSHICERASRQNGWSTAGKLLVSEDSVLANEGQRPCWLAEPCLAELVRIGA